MRFHSAHSTASGQIALDAEHHRGEATAFLTERQLSCELLRDAILSPERVGERANGNYWWLSLWFRPFSHHRRANSNACVLVSTVPIPWRR